MVAWSHSPSSRYRLLSTDVPRGPLFGLTSGTETSRLLVWSHRDTRQVSNYRRSIPYHLSTRSSIMAFRPTRIILRMVRARTIRGSLPFSLRIWKNSYFRKNRSLNDHRIVGEKEIIGCFSNSRVSINEATHWVSLPCFHVVCTNVDSTLSLNSALHELPSTYLHIYSRVPIKSAGRNLLQNRRDALCSVIIVFPWNTPSNLTFWKPRLGSNRLNTHRSGFLSMLLSSYWVYIWNGRIFNHVQT